MKAITAARSLELAAKSWRPGTKMQTIIADGWSRGFHKEQTLHECIQAGYSACLAGPAIDKRWAMMDEEYAKHRAESDAKIDDLFDRADWPDDKLVKVTHDLRSPEDKASAIKRYEDYWAKDISRAHHQLDCTNPHEGECDAQLKIPRPPRGSGEMWDSLATCPYCNATFFYESRYLRVDAAFKGFF